MCPICIYRTDSVIQQVIHEEFSYCTVLTIGHHLETAIFIYIHISSFYLLQILSENLVGHDYTTF